MTVQVEGDGNRTAGVNYTEDRSVRAVHLNIGTLAIGVSDSAVIETLPPEDLRARSEHLHEVRRALRRRFVLHRSVFVHLASCALFVAAVLAGWADSSRWQLNALSLIIGVGAVIPSAIWMVRERNALYAEMRRNREERFALERALVRAEAEAEAIANRR